MENMLVHSTPFEIEKDKWGYKWLGFCYGKRFSVILNPETESYSDEENGNYILGSDSERKSLPEEIRKLTYAKPLSNDYFLLSKGKETSIEVVMMLIERGYNIENIIKKPYLSYINGKHNGDTYLCEYMDKKTERVIVEILDDESVLWKGDQL